MHNAIEASYPLQFRKADTKKLGDQLRHHNSVILIGMKRVGISNFLRFFLGNTKAHSIYVPGKNTLFVSIDLNNLVERTVYAFWILTLKCLTDEIQNAKFGDAIEAEAHSLFTQCIQLHDCFFTLQAVQKVLTLLASQQVSTNIFFLRFDRITHVITPEFMANLQGLRDAVEQVSFVVTSYRPLHELASNAFGRTDLSTFLHELYIKPADQADTQIILSSLAKNYGVTLSKKLSEKLFTLTGGHVQYLQLCILFLHHHPSLLSSPNLESELLKDEEILFLSEELFTNLQASEKKYISELVYTKSKVKESETNVPYLYNTGIVQRNPHGQQIFNHFLAYYIQSHPSHTQSSFDFTKKEQQLFDALFTNFGTIVERERLIELVWPEEVELGVSDWAIDRLVARVRHKLKLSHSPHKIITVITRGYKLT